MKKVIVIHLCLIVFSCASAQNLGNEWIDFDNTYYKMRIGADGVYKITHDVLQEAGIPVASIDPRSIKLWHRGKELAIKVEGENDGVFNVSDYILFYAKANDGANDLGLYRDPSHQFHSYTGLYSDTSTVFLSWGGVSGNRIVNTNFSDDNLSEESFANREQIIVYRGDYSFGDEPSSYVFLSENDQGEGWVSTRIGIGSTFNPSFQELNDVYTNDPLLKPVLKAQLIGRNKHLHKSFLEVGEGSGVLYNFPDFSAYERAELTVDIDGGLISDGQLPIEVTTEGDGTNVDFVSLSFVQLTYPSDMDVGGSTHYDCFFTNKSSDHLKVRLKNVPANAVIFEVSDPYNPTLPVITDLGNDAQVILSNDADTCFLELFSEQVFNNINELFEVDFVEDNQQNVDYLIISHNNLSESVEEYEQYRSSATGGNYDVKVAYIDRLYDQYFYGEQSPMAIRNYCEYMAQNNELEYLFLIGKAYAINMTAGGQFLRYSGFDISDPNTGEPYYESVVNVPTFGVPGSDNMFTSQLSSEGFVPYIATGRLSAYNNEHVRAYLQKVKEYEARVFDDLAYKRMIHLGGGKFESERNTFRNWLGAYEQDAEGTYLGGEVQSFYKNTNLIAELFNLSQELNEGVGMITFFGHSAPSLIEIDLGLVSDPTMGYKNKGKYPFMYYNSCEAGNFFYGQTKLEDWLWTADKGAIGAIAHTSFAYSSQLNVLCDLFYKNAFADSSTVNASVGNVFQWAMHDFVQKSDMTGSRNYTQVQQMALMSDPAIKMFPVSKPDYHIEESKIHTQTFNNSILNALTDSFNLAVPVCNFALSPDDSIHLSIERYYNNGQEQDLYSADYAPIFFQDTLFITIRDSSEIDAGLNTFVISLDPDDSIPEINETNNVVIWNLFLNSNGVRLLCPQEFAIVGNSNVTFSAQVFDLQETGITYEFELDTNYNFTAPIESRTIQSDALVQWNVSLSAPIDSSVYYWRLKRKDGSSSDTAWQQASFMYLNEETGWAQKRKAQLYRNDIDGLLLDENLDTWRFDSLLATIELTTTGAGIENFKDQIVLTYRGQIVFDGLSSSPCLGQDGIYVVAFDISTLNGYHPFQSNPNTQDLSSCTVGYFHLNNTTNQQSLLAYLNALDDNDFLLFFSAGHETSSEWDPELVDRIKEFGALKIDSLGGGGSYAFLGSANGTLLDEKLADSLSTVVITNQLVGKRDQALHNSALIGPASQWNTYMHDFDITSGDEFYISLYGYDQSFNATFLLTLDVAADDSVDLLELGIHAEEYPYLKIKSNLKDSVNLSPPHLDDWLIKFQGVPEGIINVSLLENGVLSQESVHEGDSVRISLAFINIGEQAYSDSVLVNAEIKQLGTETAIRQSQYIAPLGGGDTLFFDVVMPTEGLDGASIVEVFVNPFVQQEKFFDNNTLLVPVEIIADEENPILDVTFDGVRIMNGDIVSPSPLIQVRIADRNTFSPIRDTSSLQLFMKGPCNNGACEYEPLYFSHPSIIAWEQQSEDQPFNVEFKPDKLPDGTYSLRVDGEDNAGNKAGSKPYEISFEVVNKRSITHFLPYPNPFSTNVKFVFTLTGDKVPDELKIQIMTVGGTVVKEILQDEIGPLHIGNNITQYAWDGRDQFGDQLANGVYLYRVITHIEGEAIEHRSTSADRAFKREFGKMYLLR